MIERVVSFGADRALVGVLTMPRQVSPDAPALVFLNAGVVHRVGPNRLHVTLARRVAEAGYPAFRFDLAGLGDSGARRGDGTLADAAVRDTRDAMDHLERTVGIRRFALFGICTGAQHAFEAAYADPRVSGVLMVDGYAYRTPGYWLRHYGRRLGRAESWMNIVRGRNGIGRGLRRLVRMHDDEPGANEGPELFEFPAREIVARKLRELAARGVAARFTYTASWEPYFNHASQFAEMFGVRHSTNRVCADYLAGCDHTFTPLAQQEMLIDLVRGWMSDVYAPGTAEARISKASMKYLAAQLGNAM